jgi:dTDP-glucose 4,6-dehydratase
LACAYFQIYSLPVLTSNGSNHCETRQLPDILILLMIVNALEGKPLPIYGEGR